jgi:hypothetical protein
MGQKSHFHEKLRRIWSVCLRKRGIMADPALRLARYEKAEKIEREVEPLSVLQPAMA